MTQSKFFPKKGTNSQDFKDKIYDFKLNEISEIEQIREVTVEFAEKINENITVEDKSKDGIFFQDTKEGEEKLIDDEDASLELKEKIKTYLKSDDEFFKNPKMEKYDKIVKFYEEIKKTSIVPEEVGDDEDNEGSINNKEYEEDLEKEQSTNIMIETINKYLYIVKCLEIADNLDELIKNMGKKKKKIDYIDYKNQMEKLKKMKATAKIEKKDVVGMQNQTSQKSPENMKDNFIEYNKK